MSQSVSERRLGSDSLLSLFARYAGPGVVALLFLAAQTIADGVIIGRFIDASALAAVNIASPAYSLVTALAFILGVGTQAQIGLYLGKGDYRRAKNALKSGTMGVFLFAVLGTTLAALFPEEIARLLGANEELLPQVSGYIRGLTPGLIGIAGFIFLDYILKILGHTKLAMGLMIGAIVSNILLSIFFVTSLGMGTYGAGLGTGLSFLGAGIISAISILRLLRQAPGLYEAHGKFSMRSFGQIFYNGSSEGIADVAMGISTYLFNITLLQYAGTSGVAAFTLINYLIFVGSSVLLGISNGVIPIISYNYGAEHHDRVWGTIRLSMKWIWGFSLVVMTVLWFFAGDIIALFLGEGEERVLQIATEGAHLVSLAFLFNGINLFASSFFTATGRAGSSLLVAGLRGLVFVALGIFILPRFIGLQGVWLTLPTAELLTALTVLFLARRIKRGTKA